MTNIMSKLNEELATYQTQVLDSAIKFAFAKDEEESKRTKLRLFDDVACMIHTQSKIDKVLETVIG